MLKASGKYPRSDSLAGNQVLLDYRGEYCLPARVRIGFFCVLESGVATGHQMKSSCFGYACKSDLGFEKPNNAGESPTITAFAV